MDNYRLSDLLDMSLIQTLADSNYHATGLPMSIIDAFDKSFLVRAGWTDLCMKFHRANPASNQICLAADAAVRENLVAGEVYQYKCQFGLWHIAIPIMVAGGHLATMFMTQFCIKGEVPEQRFYLQKAEEFGYDLPAYMTALDRVPIFSQEKLNYIIAYDQALVRFISGLGEQALEVKKGHELLEERVRERTAELAKAKEFLENIFDNTADAIGLADRRGHLTKWNKAAEAMYGYSFAELQGIPAFRLYADPNELAKMLHQLRRDSFVKHYEINMRRKNGTIFPCSLSVRLLRGEDYKVIGSVTVSRDLTETKETLARLELANEKLQNLVAEADQRSRQMILLQEMNDFFQSCQTSEETFSAFAHYAAQFFPGYIGALYTLHNSENLLEMAASWGDTSSLELVFGPQECWGLRRSRAFIVDDTQTALNCSHVTNAVPAAYLCLPMMAQGKAIGILHLQRLTLEPEETIRNIEQYARTISEALSMALSNFKLRETLHNQAIRDGLTGLFNRRYLEETLERELSRSQRLGTSLGVVMLDLDHFKEYNDSFGHNAGDELLCALAQLLQEHIRKEDIACRYGGEEFLLVMPGAPPEVVKERVEDLIDSVRQLHQRSPSLRPITISAGVAFYPKHGSAIRELIRTADTALYRAKDEGRDRVVVAP